MFFSPIKNGKNTRPYGDFERSEKSFSLPVRVKPVIPHREAEGTLLNRSTDPFYHP